MPRRPTGPWLDESLRRLISLALGVAISLGAAGCSRDELALVGTVERKALELAAPISEVITDLPVPIGGRVEAQQVVVQLDTTVAQAELAAAEAAEAAADAALTEAEGSLRRQQELRRAKVATQQALDAARRARDECLAQSAERAARVAQARKRLEDLTVRAFAPGIVDQLPYEPGERPPAGGVVAVVMADERPWVRVWLPARAVARIGDQTAAQVQIHGFPEALDGTVTEIAREPEFTPHYALTERETANLVYETKIRLENAPETVRPGLSAEVTIALATP